jgi:hypothetical protein
MGEGVWSTGNDNRTGCGGDISGHSLSYHNGIDEPHVEGRRSVARNIPEGMGPMGHQSFIQVDPWGLLRYSLP